ncbi:uncharacterized protein LOC133300307 [Gastrolobium bilobum]|uniref:uncharacterized protein LOC133300307 n=1 Tax=Gastrolobium bilobum TaxID=150636 RepID=UPI002AB1AC5F|nr:uncharacterized protein LOC133300307 [Gastrolobium bilobum]
MAKGQQPPKPYAGNSSSSQMEDSSSPYFLHSVDLLGLILVTDTLSGPNYHTWHRAMTMALTAKNKFQFVDGSLPQPNPDDLLYCIWVRCNSMVCSWILNAVSREIVDSLIYIPTAHDIWNDLRDRFQQGNAPRIFQLKSQIAALQQGSLTVTAYYTRLKTFWDELCEFQPVPVCQCGGLRTWYQYHEQDSSLQLLM